MLFDLVICYDCFNAEVKELKFTVCYFLRGIRIYYGEVCLLFVVSVKTNYLKFPRAEETTLPTIKFSIFLYYFLKYFYLDLQLPSLC